MSRYLKAANAALVFLSALGLIFLTAVITFDVIVRNLNIFYLRGVMDFVILSQILLASCAIPAAFLTGRHLVVELGTWALSDLTKSRMEAFWLLLAAPVFVWLSQLVLNEGLHVSARGRTIGVHALSPNVYHLPVAFGLFAAGLACLVMGGMKLVKPVAPLRGGH